MAIDRKARALSCAYESATDQIEARICKRREKHASDPDVVVGLFAANSAGLSSSRILGGDSSVAMDLGDCCDL